MSASGSQQDGKDLEETVNVNEIYVIERRGGKSGLWVRTCEIRFNREDAERLCEWRCRRGYYRVKVYVPRAEE